VALPDSAELAEVRVQSLDDFDFFLATRQRHLSFTIDGQQQRLSAVTEFALRETSLRIDPTTENNRLEIHRMSSDNNVSLSLTADNIPVRRLEKGMAYEGNSYTPATIWITSSQLSGSLYCPHEEDGMSMSYRALVRFDSFDETGRMKGTFMTQTDQGNPVELTDGTFDLHVNLRE